MVGVGLEPFSPTWTLFDDPPPPAAARSPSCGGSSRTARGPIGRSAARPSGSGSTRATSRLATRLAYGAVQRRATLDHVIETLAGRPLDRLEPAVLAALRLGIFQLVYLDRVPDHAAVGESVELAKADSRGGAGLVNAVLRRAAREARGAGRRAARRHAGRPPRCATRTPSGSRALWWETLGPDGARALMAADNEPAEAALRANTLRTTAAELAARLPVPSHRRPACRRAARARGAFDAHGAPEWREGLFMPQSRAAMAVARAARARARASACSTCAPRPAARRPTSPR